MNGFPLGGVLALEYARKCKMEVTVSGDEAQPDWIPTASPDAPGLAEAVKAGTVSVEVVVPLHVKTGRKPLEELQPEALDVVGKIPDAQAAKVLGVSSSTVARCRARLGIPKAGNKNEATKVAVLEERIRKLEAQIAGSK